jgi:hypothetical protein
MPEFFPEHDGAGRDEFESGYLGAAEWLIDTDSPAEEGGIDRNKIRGWHSGALKSTRRDCRDFQKANAADLALYCEISGRGESSAGHDFWLSRNGHGAGFFDRGNDPVFDRLQDAARHYGERNVYLYRGRLRFYESDN